MPSGRSGIDFTEEADADLLGFMAIRDEEVDAARDAFAEFYERHAPWLLTTVAKKPQLTRLVGGLGAAEDIVQDTFLRVFRRAETYRPGHSSDPAVARRHVRAWIGGVANNLIRDWLRAEGQGPQLVPLEEDRIEMLRPTDRPEASPQEKAIRRALLALSDRERDILLAWAYFYKPGAEHQRMPNADSAALAARWDTTPENVRQIRRRAFRRIRQAVDGARTPFAVKEVSS